MELSRRLNDADEVMRQTSQLLALISHQTGMVTAPDDRTAEVHHIEVMPVSSTRAAVLLADSLGRVHTMMVPLDEALRTEDLPRLGHFLNDNLRGVALSQVTTKMESTIRSMLEEKRRTAEQALHLLNLLPAGGHGQLYLEGAAQLFEQPEFRDVERAREVFGMLDERERLATLLRGSLVETEWARPSVLIGSESHEPAFKEISVVASPYRIGKRPVGVLGILGPRRMPYSRLTAIVDYTAGMLSKFLTRLAG
jgi:heat-inducible transcriptional repressor